MAPIKIIPQSDATEWRCYAVYRDARGQFQFDGETVRVESCYAPTNLQCRWVVSPSYWDATDERTCRDAGIVAIPGRERDYSGH